MSKDTEIISKLFQNNFISHVTTVLVTRPCRSFLKSVIWVSVSAGDFLFIRGIVVVVIIIDYYYYYLFSICLQDFVTGYWIMLWRNSSPGISGGFPFKVCVWPAWFMQSMQYKNRNVEQQPRVRCLFILVVVNRLIATIFTNCYFRVQLRIQLQFYAASAFRQFW